MYFTSYDDANVFAKLSIELIRKYQHKIHRLSVSNDKRDILYANNVNELNVAKIVDFLYSFNYDEFKKLTEKERENIFSELMNLYKELIWDSDNLRLKYLKKYFRE